MEVREGQSEVEVRLPPLRTLTVKNAKGRGFSLIDVTGEGDATQHIVRGNAEAPDADVELSYVPDGRYEVAVYDPATRTTSRYPVTVAGDGAVLDLATAKSR